MTRYIWARVFIASLVFLGDLAFAAENRLRVEIEAAAGDITTQISTQTIPNDSEPGVEPAIMEGDTTPPVIFTSNQKLVSIACTATNKLKYLPSHPRAPPHTPAG